MNSQFKNSSLGFYLYAFLIVIIVAAVAFVFWFMITGYKLGTYEENTLLGSVYVGGLKEEEVEPIMFTRIDRWLGDETILFEAKYQGYSYAFNRELFDFNITQSTQNIVNGKTNQLEVYFGGSKKQDIIRELKSLVFIQGIKENIDYDSLVDDVLRDASLMKSYSVKNFEDYLIDETLSYEIIGSEIIYIPNSVNIDSLIAEVELVYEDGKILIPSKFHYDIIDELGGLLDDKELGVLSSAFLKLILDTNFSINEVHYENRITSNGNYTIDDFPYFGFNSIIFERENESFSFYNPNEGYFYFELVKVEGSETQLQVNLIGLPFVNQITADVVKTEIDHITKITTDENDTKSGVNGVVVEVVRIITSIEDYVIYNQVIVFEFYPPEVEIILEP